MEKEIKKEDLLGHKFEYVQDKISEDEKTLTVEIAEEYKRFIDEGKTERECCQYIERLARENGFSNIDDLIKENVELQPGMKVYGNNRDKSIILFIIGEDSIESGMKIVGGHIDSPRIDLKPTPLYEDSGMAYFKTHYYGGIRKYQWASLPLSIHGVVINEKGEKISISIGEEACDPIFFISDLLPHLAKDQNKKSLAEGIEGEGLNLIVGNTMSDDKEAKERFKLKVLEILNEKYNVTEEDFMTAELEIVPAGKARDAGFDRSMIVGYGHDDRSCSFAGMKAILDIEGTPKKTVVGMFMDKEEVGSMGNTGSESKYFENMVAELMNLQMDNYKDLYVRRAFMNTKVLSADVGAAYDPNYASAYDKRNSPFMGKGIVLVKYTGARGKSGCNDANAEFVHEVRDIFNRHDVIWQTGELGKVDQGGGGTIAYILANAGADVIDCGIPVISMHAPYEMISKADLYMTYKGYKAFLID